MKNYIKSNTNNNKFNKKTKNIMKKPNLKLNSNINNKIIVPKYMKYIKIVPYIAVKYLMELGMVKVLLHIMRGVLNM